MLYSFGFLKPRVLAVFSLALAQVFAAQTVLACACCAEHGERYEYQQERGSYEDYNLFDLRFSEDVYMFEDACGVDCIEGIENPQRIYSAGMFIENGVLQISFSDGRSILRMHLDETYEVFSVDTDPMAQGGSATLYNEDRFPGKVEATGAFQAANGADGTLIVAGHGNHCRDSMGYSHWFLDVDGESTYFRLYGGFE